MAEWVDLLDPDEKTLHDALPPQIHERALELLLQQAVHDDEPLLPVDPPHRPVGRC